MTDDMDVNAGDILDRRDVPIEAKGREIYEAVPPGRVWRGDQVRGPGPRRLRVRTLADRRRNVSDANVLRLGLIGDHIGRSRFSAAMDLLCRAHGLTLDFTPIDTGEFPDFDFDAKIEQLIADDWTGVTITHPHKTAARTRRGMG